MYLFAENIIMTADSVRSNYLLSTWEKVWI